jgi:hypothetical protein
MIVSILIGILTRSTLIIQVVIAAFLIGILFYAILILNTGLSPKNKNFFLKQQITFGDNSILIKTPISEGTVKWEAFNNWRKVAGYYLLYPSNTSFLAIHRLDVPASEMTAFEDLLRTKIKKVK